MNKQKNCFLIFRFSVIIMWFLLFCPKGITQETIKIATAGREGNYFKIGLQIKETLETLYPGIYTVDIIDTDGSRDNAGRLERKEVDFALIQNDVVYYSSYFSVDMVGVAVLYSEPLHILSRRELGWTNTSDILFSDQSIRVGLGPKTGGTYSNAIILIAHALKRDQIKELHYTDFTKSLNAMRRRELDILYDRQPI